MALPKPFSSGAFIFDLTDTADETKLLRLLRQRGVSRTAFSRIWEIVRRNGCEGGKICQSVVLEAEYVDRDYAEGYGQLYGRAFRQFERLCYRLHFFSVRVQPQDFNIPSLSLKKDQKMWGKLKESYLGFSVIRPSCPDTVGRTVILPPKSPEEDSFALARSEYSLSLAGLPLTASGVPFMEQDGMVGACASAAMWMAHMCLYKNRGLPTYSTTEITRLADVSFPSPSRVFPSEGLTVDQVGAGLKRMGHETFMSDFPQTSLETVKHWLYIHIESRIPVILATDNQGEGHAVVIVGHTLGTPNLETPTYEFATGERVYGSHCWASNVLVHDDQRGPYLRATIVSSKRKEPKAALKYLTGGGESQLNILAAIALLPPHVNCDGLRAEGKAIRLLHWLRRRGIINFADKENTRLVVRTFLVTSNEFKEKMDASRGIGGPLILSYRLLHLPRHVWVTEWTTLDLWDRPVGQKRILGEVLVDPTSNPYNLDFLALHAPGILYFMNPDERDATPALRRPLEIPNDISYTPLTRAAS